MSKKQILGLAATDIQAIDEGKTIIKYSYLKIPSLDPVEEEFSVNTKQLKDFIFKKKDSMKALLSLVSNHVERNGKDKIGNIMSTKSLEEALKKYKEKKL